MQPLGHETCGNGSSDAPGCDIEGWEVLGNGFGEELHHGPGDTADLHPAFENATFLLPEVVDAPPAFEIVEDGFDLPAVTVKDDHLAGGQMGLGREIEAGRRPALMLFVVNGAPDSPDRMTVQKSCMGDAGLKANLLPFPIDMQRNGLGRQCGCLLKYTWPHIYEGVRVGNCAVVGPGTTPYLCAPDR